MTRDLHTSTVDAARALAEDVPLIGEAVGDVFPGEPAARPAVSYVSSLAPGVVRKACTTCGRDRVPHHGADVGLHLRGDTSDLTACTAGTVRFG